jgi:PAS domain S-box-containing protein
MWFATQDGLNRYDGYGFKVFTYKPGVPNCLSNNFVYSIVEGPDRMLWIGTGDGLNLLDLSTEKFTYFRHLSEDPNSLGHNYTRTLYIDSSGILWIGTYGGGLDRFDKHSKTFRHYRHNPNDPHSISHHSVNTIIEDEKGTPWIGTAGGGFNRFDSQMERFARYLHDPNNPNSLSSDNISCMAVDGKGNLWIGTWGGGLNRFNRDTHHFTIYRHEPEDPNSLSSNTIYSLLFSSTGELWIGTRNGLNLFDPVSKRFTHYKNKPDNPNSLNDDRILSLFQDRTGDTWIGTASSGINRFDCGKMGFFLYRSEPGNPNSLSANNTYAFYEEDSRVLWIGTRGGGLNRLDRRSNTFECYKNEPGNPFSLSHNEVNAVYRDSTGILWIGTFGGGLNRFIEKRSQFIRYMMNPQTPGSLDGNYTSCIFEDSSNVLWIGTMDGGLNRFDRETDCFISYKKEPGNPSGLSSNFIRTIHEDPSGFLWIGTQGGGLNRFDKTVNRFIHYRHIEGNPNTLCSDMILAFHQDREGIFWIGTAGMGLNRFDPTTRQFTHFTHKDGLPDNTIYAILEDDHGSLWLSTNRGLSKFNPAARSFRNYDVNDGLQSNEFNFNAAFKSKSGEMFFGGVNGFNAFYPDKIQDNPHIPPVVITGFKLFNKSIGIGDRHSGRSILTKSIMDTDAITLSYKDSVFSFEYTALNYEMAKKNQYAYIMEGFETEWNDVGTRRFATYTNLPSGEYVFKVKGSNNDGTWNEEGVSLKITITPPFWNTWGFKLSGLLVGLLVIITFYKIRIHNIHKRSMQLEKMNITLNREIAERQRVEEALQEKEERYRILFELSPSGILLEDIEGNVIDANPAFSESLGYVKEEIIGRKAHMFTHPDVLHEVDQNIQGLLSGNVLKHAEKSIKKDGTTCYMNLNEKKVTLPDGKDGIICITEDFTDRIMMEEKIKASLREKEVLLREIHHRVKNNLQTIVSLLNLQSRYIKDKQALEVFKNSQERVRTMALIHEKLYESKDLAKIDFREYIQSLTAFLFDSYSLKPEQIQLKMQMGEVFLDMETAIPLGLLINELVSNSLKYAFPHKRRGELLVKLEEIEDEEYDYTLIVRDNGVGFPDHLDSHACDSLGMVLVHSLVKKLKGVIDLERKDGTGFTIKFKKLNYKKRI